VQTLFSSDVKISLLYVSLNDSLWAKQQPRENVEKTKAAHFYNDTLSLSLSLALMITCFFFVDTRNRSQYYKNDSPSLYLSLPFSLLLIRIRDLGLILIIRSYFKYDRVIAFFL
jgi:hypothetical protein